SPVLPDATRRARAPRVESRSTGISAGGAAMTAPSRQPGERLVKLATLLFDEPTRSTFVIPALADYQQELAEAGESAFRQLTAHLRGYAAFARLVLAAPF